MIDTTKSVALAEEERKQIELRRSKIRKIAKEIDKIFIREEFTMGDVLEVFGIFVERSNRVFAEQKISEIKKNYENN